MKYTENVAIQVLTTGIQVYREADLVKIWVLKCENASKAVKSGAVVEEVGY